MSVQTQQRFTPEEYLARERQAQYKSEYFNGEIFAMSGASREHNLISMNISAALHLQLRQRPCEVYAGDMRVKVSPTGLYTYPDVVVVCEEPRFEDAEVDTLLNPTLVVEVLSPSTEDYDRGRKFEHYPTLASLQEYVLVAQGKHHVAHYVRQANNTWIFSDTTGSDTQILPPSINCVLSMNEIYAKVPFDGLQSA